MDWLLSVWQWVCGFSRLEWIVMGGFMMLGIWVRDVAVFHSNVLRWQIGELRKQLEEVTRDR